MSATAEGAHALLVSAGVRTRDDLCVVRVQGDDRLRWLNGQITCDARKAEAGVGVYGLAITVRGKIMADLWVLERGDHLAVLLPRTAQDAVLASFERQIIMDDVELKPDDGLCVISVQGPRAAEVVADTGLEAHRCDELNVPGQFVLAPTTERARAYETLCARARSVGGAAVDAAAFTLARLREGRGAFGEDFGDREYPQEAGLGERAVSFNKGCYLGQEVVCTLENRGRLSRRLVELRLPLTTASERGAELHNGEGQSVGSITTLLPDDVQGETIALGYVKQAEAVVGHELRAAGDTARVARIVGDGA